MKNTKFNVSVSELSYSKKPNENEKKTFTWIPTQLDVKGLYNHHINGYTIVGDFGFDKPFRKGRTKDRWISTPFICIDLDDVSLSWDELCVKLINELPSDSFLKPSYLYTTFSHQLEGKGNRYRLVYVFDDEINNIELYKDIVSFYNKEISKYLNVKLDECNLSPNQCFYGTHKQAQSFYLGIQHSTSFIVGVLNEMRKVSSNCQSLYIHNNHSNSIVAKTGQNTKCPLFSKEEIILIKSKSETDYLKENNEKYFIYKDNWSTLGDKAEKRYVITIPTNQYYDKKNNTVVYYKIPNGKGRRKWLLTTARRIHYINPNITKEELLYNLVYWKWNCILDNDKEVRWWDIYIENVNTVLNEDPNNYIRYKRKQADDDKVINNPYTKALAKRKETKSISEQDTVFNELEDKSVDSIMTSLGVSQRTAYRIISRNSDNKNNNLNKVRELMKENKKVKEIMEITNLSRSMVYSLIKLVKEEGVNKVEINITNNIGNDALKYFKDENAMKEFLAKYNSTN